MGLYKEKLSINIDETKDETIRQFKTASGNISVSGDNIIIRKHNSWLHLLAPTGKILMTAVEAGPETRLDCEILPSIFTFKSAIGFICLSVIAWSLLFWFFPLSTVMLVFFVLHWIIVCFVALYLLVGFMAVLTILLMIYNFHEFPFIYLIFAWIVTILITHLTLRYNRGSLKKYLLKLTSQVHLHIKNSRSVTGAA